ncbi:Charged multivesicular body protein 3 [Trichoplax sp. H2]|uniref:Charged multivesicular body protein 3 n=1 Tax=Trichoplax adhaerens TaxID=10228 RepID=B3S2V6_TRIAD|nr:hypothetical protein TRIADDRAFT_50591 [Trichoplax adhaerens]EDV22686.1 hypothetical protein TRIADDRAFT_50591 [Trichoplax adhaerens]RDD41970.1 Charged multivesicular body protein 3 [Trichoplax sp. H2]|eukprot:XP_002114552.1 hypothetical protein TRIADDRAFT_50591 [Trichoplax adhaerens]
MGLFGKSPPPKTPREQVREWSSKIRKEMRVIDRQIRSIDMEKQKVVKSLKDAAKRNQRDVCTVLAKEIIHSRKAVSKLYAAKAQLNSVDMHMKNQLATVRIAGSIEKSTEVMKYMNALVRLPEISATMREMSQEMTKAGIMEEMMDDAMTMDDDEEVEEAASDEVDKILFEITDGQLGKAQTAVEPLPEATSDDANQEVDAERFEEEQAEMQRRLEALRST